jgi:predicted MPP superfamily phosphohydrolase
MPYLLAALVIIGHWAICIFVINRLHATALPYRMMKVVDLLWYSCVFALPAGIVAAAWLRLPAAWWLEHPTSRALGLLYGLLSLAACVAAVWVWIRHLTDAETTARLESNHTATLDVVDQLGHRPSGSLATSVLCRLPTNQVFELWIHRKELRLPRLAAELDGLTVTHLSDLHFTGRITRPFFDLVVEQANRLDSDLVVISGDIIDKPQCFPWLTEVLGKLQSRLGVYFVLGNHDLRIRSELRLRDALTDAGLIDLGGRFQTIEARGQHILLAGNELPWFSPAANLLEAPARHPHAGPFRVAVCHSPDQIDWARSADFDLMLAGHTHGGQIRLPVIGPVFSPSRYGVKYAAGTFFCHPTLLHVSRGLSGTRPLRFNCPPELAQLVLRSEQPASRGK